MLHTHTLAQVSRRAASLAITHHSSVQMQQLRAYSNFSNFSKSLKFSDFPRRVFNAVANSRTADGKVGIIDLVAGSALALYYSNQAIKNQKNKSNNSKQPIQDADPSTIDGKKNQPNL